MKYDVEYNSYKFSSEEMKNIVDGLTFYSLYSPLDKITHKNVLNLLDSLNKTERISLYEQSSQTNL